MSNTPKTNSLAGTFYLADSEKCIDCGRRHEKVKMVTLEDASRIEQELTDEKERAGRWHDEAQAEKMANMNLEKKLEEATATIEQLKQSSAHDSQIGSVGQAAWMEKHGKDRT